MGTPKKYLQILLQGFLFSLPAFLLAAKENISAKLSADTTAVIVSQVTKLPLWYSEMIISASIIISSWLVYWIFRRYGVGLLLKLAKHTESTLDDRVIEALRTPISFILFLFGIWITLNRLKILVPYHSVINEIYVGILTLLAAFILTRIIRVGLEFYAQGVAARTDSSVDTQFVPVLRKVINVLIWITAFILILDQYNYKITSLLTTLGIGGLAVALALQDTLSNFFSGFYIMVDKPVRIHDFVKLENGSEGFIEHVGWRSTRIKAMGNNTIVIPNSKLAQSIVINYYLPGKDTSIAIDCGVGYGSDLESVENICIEVGKDVLKRVEGAEENYVPIVRYQSFGDSNILFKVILSVKDFQAQYLLKHEFMKAIYRRFRDENIEISFPKRSVFIEKLPLNLPKGRSKQESLPQPDLFDPNEPK